MPKYLTESKKISTINIHAPRILVDSLNVFNKLKPLNPTIANIQQILELETKSRDINVYLFSDMNQKFLLTYDNSYGRAIDNEMFVYYNEPGAIETIEHETIHILFDQAMGNFPNSFLSEGIVGYTQYKLQNWDLTKHIQIAKKVLDYPVQDWVDATVEWWDMPEIDGEYVDYPIMQYFTIYLIETYGLDKFKELYKHEKSQVRNGFIEVYNKNLNDMVAEWKAHVKEL